MGHRLALLREVGAGLHKNKERMLMLMLMLRERCVFRPSLLASRLSLMNTSVTDPKHTQRLRSSSWSRARTRINLISFIPRRSSLIDDILLPSEDATD